MESKSHSISDGELVAKWLNHLRSRTALVGEESQQHVAAWKALDRVRNLEEQLQSAQDEINERTSDQALTLRKYRDLQEQLEALQERIDGAANSLPDPMHPQFPRQFVDRQTRAIAWLSDDMPLDVLRERDARDLDYLRERLQLIAAQTTLSGATSIARKTLDSASDSTKRSCPKCAGAPCEVQADCDVCDGYGVSNPAKRSE